MSTSSSPKNPDKTWFRCHDCHSTWPPGPMLQHDIWRAIVGLPRIPNAKRISDIDDGWQLCSKCINIRMHKVFGRELTTADLKPEAHRTAAMDEVRICALPGCDNPVKRPNQDYCCKQHRQLAYVHEKRRQNPSQNLSPVLSPTKSVDSAPDEAREAVESKITATARPHLSSAKPCTRNGYPNGLLEAKDENGLLIFFDTNGERLSRIWGPNDISDVQLRQLKLKRTDMTFPGGRFYRPYDD
jgi:hypothetical protein